MKGSRPTAISSPLEIYGDWDKPGLSYRWSLGFEGLKPEFNAGLTALAGLAGEGCCGSAGLTRGLLPAAGCAEGLAAGGACDLLVPPADAEVVNGLADAFAFTALAAVPVAAGAAGGLPGAIFAPGFAGASAAFGGALSV